MSEDISKYVELAEKSRNIKKEMLDLEKILELKVKEFAAAFEKETTGYAFSPKTLSANAKRAKIVEHLLSKKYFNGRGITVRLFCAETGMSFPDVYNLTFGSSRSGIYGLEDLIKSPRFCSYNMHMELKDPEQAKKYLELLPRPL